MADNKYIDAKVHDWWRDSEFNCYYALLETIQGELRLIEVKIEDKK